MAVATVLSREQRGIDAPQVRVEVDIGPGLPTFNIVGLPEAAVKESKDRVRAALINSHFQFPSGRITVNLAPADLPKEGGRFDLPIATGILIASGQLKDPGSELQRCELYGELSLSGELRSMRGALPAALAASLARHPVIMPHVNAAEAALVKDCKIIVARHLLEVCAHLGGAERLEPYRARPPSGKRPAPPDLCDVRGQPHAKRALEIAAAGQHSLLFIGSPGAGKSMLAQRLPGIVPPMSDAEAMEVAALRSIACRPLKPDEWRVRPFRSPHHTASAVALVGGGVRPRPGEISLAHNGVLFLDELPEFDRHVLEVLREPLEAGAITISRAARQAEFPARFQLIAAMNPCPCGYLGDANDRCHCTADQVQRYRARISGPLLDRLDLHVYVPRVEFKSLRQPDGPREPSAEVAARVARTRELQMRRQGVCNAHLDNAAVERYCAPNAAGFGILERAMQHLGLSARGYHRVLKVARTIADMCGGPRIEAGHITEALVLRSLDRQESARNVTRGDDNP
ncbi:MAG TPA: YifB family Mg chelatase-like AAA ATPase [Steroidobacteraceae bacterium]|nr:YifB family Mg chelatase-like AAA ATPase [Steroidobacteraceae bacterium]